VVQLDILQLENRVENPLVQWERFAGILVVVVDRLVVADTFSVVVVMVLLDDVTLLEVTLRELGNAGGNLFQPFPWGILIYSGSTQRTG
jgi:hypothetical protein